VYLGAKRRYVNTLPFLSFNTNTRGMVVWRLGICSTGSPLNTALTSRYPTSLSALSIPLSLPIYIQPCMLVILLVLSDCQIPICSLFRSFAHHSTPAASVLQLLKSVTLSLQLFESVPDPTPFVVISKLPISSRPSFQST